MGNSCKRCKVHQSTSNISRNSHYFNTSTTSFQISSSIPFTHTADDSRKLKIRIPPARQDQQERAEKRLEIKRAETGLTVKVSPDRFTPVNAFRSQRKHPSNSTAAASTAEPQSYVSARFLTWNTVQSQT